MVTFLNDLTGGGSRAVVDPVASMQAVANPDLVHVALAVQQKLKTVITDL